MALTYDDLRGVVDVVFAKFPFMDAGHQDYRPHTGYSRQEMLDYVDGIASQWPLTDGLFDSLVYFVVIPQVSDAFKASYGTDVLTSLTADQIVGVFYRDAPPSAADRAAFFSIYQNTVYDSVLFNGMLVAAVKTGNLHPSPAEVEQAVASLEIADAAGWPDLSSEIPGLETSTLDFLAAIYVGAFQRAPEHEGLSYWAGEVVRLKSEGASTHDALTGVASMIYDAGNGPGNPNPEIGYNLSNADYVNHVYQNALGRAAEAEGYAYWLGQLDGGVPRQHLLHAVLDAALKPGNSDAAYLQARLLVAKYMAQESVTGPGKGQYDLHAVLQSVEDIESADIAIFNLVNGHFTVSSASAKLAEAPEASDLTVAAWLALFDDINNDTVSDERSAADTDAGIVLVGVAEPQTEPLLG